MSLKVGTGLQYVLPFRLPVYHDKYAPLGSLLQEGLRSNKEAGRERRSQ